MSEETVREVGAALAGERARVAAQLHDSALQLLLAASQDLVAAGDGDLEALSYARTALGEGIRELRQLLGDAGIAGGTLLDAAVPQPALLLFITDASRRGRFRAEVRIDTPVGMRHPLLITQLARELIGNVAKHAHARRVWVTLNCTRELELLRVEDDGIGMPRAAARAFDGHLGLTLCQERVHGAGGAFEIGPRAEGGTVATATFPPTRSCDETSADF